MKTKRITLGLTGGIAIYKSAALLRRLVSDDGADVTVIMTAAAQKFMSPLIFETFSGKPVVTEMFSREKVYTRHIDLGQDVDMVLVCPATANILAKAANGLADDMLSTVILTAGAKTVFALAMNSNMYANPITQANIRTLRELGYGIIEPESGELACKDPGKGRLAEESVILDYVRQRLSGAKQLSGKRVVVTAGPTREYLDPVRFISNRSSGKMGYALAAEARQQGADVVLISGPGYGEIPPGVRLIRVETARQMQQALREHGKDADYLFMAAAVEDISPVSQAGTKIKKSELPEAIMVTRSPDLLLDFREANQATCVVAFSVEMEDGHQRSIAKMQAKGADYIVWNDPSVAGAAFAGDTNEVILLAAEGQEWQLPLASKRAIARQIIDHVVTHRKGD
ncbi:bifunctional phosphopantothenoylcysteine decarboxylase/phosphopantothenate--cysteine ligase CoaBC [bacterium]|nr:bifunctional phosphopantothenoylcysteine decarboxylase/phosphopantothenate--cysteine ligase CoaBC [bacterium]MBU1633847.1 bifunctional phosphopantothenoylcysteine decarboxylase/phosphopantothenate--cysteine ligase CoaBC [bacterium]MBU1872934.1 bifunctional phosphopantothenoylcysteine decarboxylase/phosphopantothenate--cysteine ligase CoaBC [bacterium]